MKLEDYRVIFAVVGLVGVLLFASPTLGLVLHLPGGEKFSELWVLGPGHMAEGYPHNVYAGGEYLVYLGVGNNLGSAAYYEILVKLLNSSNALPNATSGVASELPVLYRYEVFLADGHVWEEPLTFSFADVVFSENVSYVGRVRINDGWVGVDKSAVWDNETNGYFYQLIMELWLYDAASGSFAFNDRFVTLSLNMTMGP
jgi:hypothetical protein